MGRLVGINAAILSDGGGSVGIGFAVPANMARLVMERLITKGRLRRGYLGIYLHRGMPEVDRQTELLGAGGARVGVVAPGTPAEAASLREGDFMLSLNGRKVRDPRHLRLMTAQTPPGSVFYLSILAGALTVL
ncbi:MAG: PDZ domain-containing protein [Verrucomicrobiota bacterium]|nr:PDZ domain-containing protein [Limisphaera sp.]MDW8381434.1 PDZ domain-containing protein [Verrucomicrobiota bacterium]